MLPDPDPDFLPIPDPGVKKASDPGFRIRNHGIDLTKSFLHLLIKHCEPTYPGRAARNQAPDRDRVAERALYQIAS